MADNTVLNSGTGGDTLATDDIGGVKYPRGKITLGADGVNDGDVSSANPLPVTGTVAITGVATAANQSTGNTALAAIQTAVETIDNAISGSEMQVDIVSSALPTGAATEAKQPALGTAGTASADVITVQGIASMTALKVDGSAVTQPVSAASLPLPAGASTSANQTTLIGHVDGIEALLGTIDADTGTLAGAVSGSEMQVDIVSGTVTTLTGSGVAHDAADSGNPHKIGAKATASLSGATMVAAGDRTDLFAGIDGVQITRPHCNLEDVVSGNASNTDGTSTSLIAAQGAGVKTYLTAIILTNTSSSNIYVEIKDGATAKLTIPVPANSGAVVTLPVPLGGTANTAWNFDPSAATTTVYCSAVGFKSKV